MKTNKLLLFGLILAGLALYVSCRKLDRSENQKPGETIESRFFPKHPLSNPNVKAAFNFVKSQNAKYNFVNNLVKQIGYPQWSYSMVYPYVNRTEATRNHPVTDSAVVVYIPFARDGQGFINSALIVRMLNRDTAYQFLMDWQYKQLGFDTTRTGWNAWDLFHLFTRFDYNVYGHKEFRILDSNLFRGDSVTVKILPDSSATGRLEPQVQCTFYQIVTCGPAGQGRSSDVVFPSCNTSYQMYCTTTWVYFPDSDGGGGGGGGWTPPDPCAGLGTGGREPDLPPGCGGTGGGGWVPIGIDEPPPQTPPNDSTIAANLKKAYEKCRVLADTLFARALQDTLERCFTYVKTASDTIGKYEKTGTKYTSSPTLDIKGIGINHTHQDEGPANQDQCFDAPDIYKLYYHKFKNEPIGDFSIITTRNYVYAAVITDPTKFISYIRSICGSVNMDDIYNSLEELFTNSANSCGGTCSFQKKTEKGTLTITGNNNSAVSGIKIFKSPRNNINFTLLTP